MNRFRRFMMGRYGIDQLSMALLAASLLILIIGRVTNLPFLSIISAAAILISYSRALSRNINKRYQENYKFLRWWNPVFGRMRGFVNRIKGIRTHRYFKCTTCKQILRVPRGKGRVKVTCPKCKTIMIKKA